MELTPISQRFILHWGEMGTRWGVNRTMSQIHALLFLAARPMHAEEIVETLGVARSNVSNSLKELQSWKLVKIVHVMGDRRDHFETSGDVWDLFRTIVLERKRRELDPTVETLRQCVDSEDFAKEDLIAQHRIKETLGFMETLSGWSEEMIRLESDMLMKIMKTGAKIQQFVRGKKDNG
jgi:DNA-binding transcriptional regulator GbsR (MarR family)